MPFQKSDYSRKATLPVRQAMVRALARFVAEIQFTSPDPFVFEQVFEEWAGYLDRVVYPSAVVLPPAGPWKYADSELEPALMDETSEPVDPNGLLLAPGFALYKLSEFEEEFELSFRAASPGQRDAIMLGLESAFHAPGILMDDPQGGRNGVILPLPEYYSLVGRFAVVSGRVEDDADSAMRNVRDAVLTISAQTQQVAVGPVFPLSLTISVNF